MRGFAAGLGLTAIALVSMQLGTVGAQDDASKPAYYTAKVKPILDANCGSCHMGENRKGGLNIDTRAGLLKGGRDGAAVVPGDPANSLLVKLIRHEGPADDPMPMPPKKPKMSDDDIAVITAWVKAGAVMPPDPPKEP
jgi:mono/diheme cytochrome c family protein